MEKPKYIHKYKEEVGAWCVSFPSPGDGTVCREWFDSESKVRDFISTVDVPFSVHKVVNVYFYRIFDTSGNADVNNLLKGVFYGKQSCSKG